MTNFIPIFPLKLVAYPGEKVNLHIFEPRYIQLIKDCIAQEKLFGIPTLFKGSIAERGTLLQVEHLEKEYDDGKMDICTRGVSVFRVLELIKEVPEKLYQGAIVSHQENIDDGRPSKMKTIMHQIQRFHKMLDITKTYESPNDELRSFDVAHHVGLSLEQEYELLGLTREIQRQEYIQQHLSNVLPTVSEIKKLQERIRLNGHFKKLSADDE